jgi:GDPmannose 4,6-dehydratase
MHAILQHDTPIDLVVATGETRSVREMCEYVFSKLDLNYRDFVQQDQKYMRPEELPYLRGDSTRIKTELGWQPKYTFYQLMDEMIDHWMSVYKSQQN